jgi:predicted amidohydrolase
MKMRLAVVQTAPAFGEKAANLVAALELMSSHPADLYVLPELFATGYNFVSPEEAQNLAEPFPGGETFKEVAAFCSKNDCFVVYGFAEACQGRLYNSAALVGPNGTTGLYRKIHLYDREKLFFAPGDLGFEVFDLPWGKLGIMICFDWYFPESARTLTLKGAQLIAHPANLVLPHCPDSMPVRCRENRVFAATANRVGEEDRGGAALTFIGKSQLTSPRGEILCRLSPDRPEIIVLEIDPAQASDKQLNPHNHLLEDRRPQWYWHD